MLAVRAGEVTHVFDHAYDIHLHLAEHFDGFARILQRDVGRRRNNDRAGQWDSLNQRERYVSGSGRQVDYQIVQLSPLHRAQELLDDRMQHGAAPDERLVSGIEEAHGDNFESVRVDGGNLIFAHHFRLLVGAEHQRNVWSVDVAVEQPYFVTHPAKSDG